MGNYAINLSFIVRHSAAISFMKENQSAFIMKDKKKEGRKRQNSRASYRETNKLLLINYKETLSTKHVVTVTNSFVLDSTLFFSR